MWFVYYTPTEGRWRLNGVTYLFPALVFGVGYGVLTVPLGWPWRWFWCSEESILHEITRLEMEIMVLSRREPD